ncbi:GNAT family N-acetyltransferase [Planococcus sp. SSTMD024]|uniref:GNAT family N-acetyltransferase n=1 Tax=Planococcus sp. SSTMD024 TaxID=3242163 RepID=UPI00351DBF74
MIHFKEVDRHNFADVIGLKVAEHQKSFVAPNVYSLAQAKAYPECVCSAVYHDDELVGFTMYCLDQDDQEYWIYRLMIDEKHQSKGYGKLVMKRLIAELQQDREHHMIYLSFEPANKGAKKLYEQLGFMADGRIIEGEIVYKLTY